MTKLCRIDHLFPCLNSAFLMAAWIPPYLKASEAPGSLLIFFVTPSPFGRRWDARQDTLMAFRKSWVGGLWIKEMQWVSSNVFKQYVRQPFQIIKTGKEMYSLGSYVELLWLEKFVMCFKVEWSVSEKLWKWPSYLFLWNLESSMRRPVVVLVLPHVWEFHVSRVWNRMGWSWPFVEQCWYLFIEW